MPSAEVDVGPPGLADVATAQEQLLPHLDSLQNSNEVRNYLDVRPEVVLSKKHPLTLPQSTDDSLSSLPGRQLNSS